MSTRIGWAEIKGACPACGGKGWCSQTPDGTVVQCRRGVVSDKSVKQRDGAISYIHHVATLGKVLKPARAKASAPRLGLAELALRIKQNKSAVNPERLAKFAASLGVGVKRLEMYSVGWDSQIGAWTFPMYDVVNGKLRPVGMSTRFEGGEKRGLPGGNNGIFVPHDYDVPQCPFTDDPRPYLILSPEGVTDCCAIAEYGFRAIGRPSNSGGRNHIIRLLELGGPQDVILIGERDVTHYYPDGVPFWPGIEGATSICETLLNTHHQCRFVLPPEPFKDFREWHKSKPKHEDVICWAIAASVVTRKMLGRMKDKLAKMKEEQKRAPNNSPAKVGPQPIAAKGR